MGSAETLIVVKRLLGMYPGVAIDPLTRRERIVLKVSELTSLARITYAKCASNVAGSIWSESTDPKDLRIDLRISDEKETEQPPSDLQVLGAYLVWDLARQGALERGEANKLLASWHCASVQEHFGGA